MELNDTPSAQNLENLEQFWSIKFFFAKNRFLPLRRSAPRPTLKLWRSISQKLSIFGFFMTNYTCSATAKTFHGDLSPQKVKKQAKNDLLPLFGHTGSSLVRLQFWRGKWKPNWEIPLGLESRHPDLSKKPTCASFGFREVPQKWPERRATRWENLRDLHLQHRKTQQWLVLTFWLDFSSSLMYLM